MKSRTIRSRRQGGFTLVEMSVVLVIAGLLFAAVATGQELINTAKAKKVVSTITALDAQLQLYAQTKGRFPGDCDANGVIDYAADETVRGDAANLTRAGLYAFSSALPTIPAAGVIADEQTHGCALTGGTGTGAAPSTVAIDDTNANVWLNDLKLAGMLSDSAPNRTLAKTATEDFLFVGKITDSAGASAEGANYNAIVIHNVPQWMAVRMAQAINGQDAKANRSRLRSLVRSETTLGNYETTWQIVDGAAADMRDATVTVAYFFDQVPESQL